MRDENQSFPSDSQAQSERTRETTRRRTDTDARRKASEATPVEKSKPATAGHQSAETPDRIDHFDILEKLGEGGFATVYRAHDTKLDREVAIKVPHFRELNQADLGALYLHEARAMARLDHPHIIKVFEANRTESVPCYLVTQLIDGDHFGDWIESNQLDWESLARIFQRLAEALGFAHDHGIIHRDVKPNNIFIRRDGVPFIGDFGLASRDRIDGGVSAGTPSYMSPEQARGEGHRVDGRSDLFSLGIVLYRVLTGEKPFQGDDTESLQQAILHSDPPHPGELRADVPAELARICLRALSKAACDRHQSGSELAAELSDFATAKHLESASNRDVAIEKVVPRGLRAFDADDAEHFLHLLPGPRDRGGLPEAVRSWLSKLDPSDLRKAIPVGLIYGPSGCGKTSLVRAGVIPRLPATTNTIYLQATSEGTERELSDALRRRAPGLTETTGLPQQIAQLRRTETRTVIFIDQFEQWLLSHPKIQFESLTEALRQCDGEHVQCVLLVRDDFWLTVSRFMQALEHPIAENETRR
ncbi:MAG: protein kinase [Planctomycetota bacterium]